VVQREDRSTGPSSTEGTVHVETSSTSGRGAEEVDASSGGDLLSRIRTQTIVIVVVSIIILGLWQLGVQILNVSEFVLPSPWAIATSFSGNWNQLTSNAEPTFIESFIGYLIGNALGVVTAALIAEFRFLEIGLYPYIIAFRSLPVISVVPLFIIWMGFTIWPIVGAAALIVFFPTFVNGVDGFKATDETTLELMRGLNASRWQTFWYVKVWNALPYMFAALKISIASALIGAVVGEWIIGQRGLGYLTILANNYVDTLLLFRALLGLGVIAVVWFIVVRALEAHFLRWQRARP
jgi:NitT/TauT family transport system permease protein